jgi:7-carboxy-7-deazaguanine synthase
LNINLQAIEKKVSPAEALARERLGGALEVHSIFRTLQGEGPFTGYPAIFIRLAGCNLQCPACDTDYTSQRTLLSAAEILQQTLQLCIGYQIKLIVITGGEPLRQDLTQLCIVLHQRGFMVQIETNGTLAIPQKLINYIADTNINNSDKDTTRPWFNIVCSPKTGKTHPSLNPYIIAWKYVMSSRSMNPVDGLPILALEHSAIPYVARPVQKSTRKYIPIYLQPCDDKDTILNKENMLTCIESCLKHGYIMQLQTHKYLDIE